MKQKLKEIRLDLQREEDRKRFAGESEVERGNRREREKFFIFSRGGGGKYSKNLSNSPTFGDGKQPYQ